ncbi:MAG: MBL fold metallo-hydrolase [Treponema sp.]|nr:MBL fold metallo-hydrolase [Treponema sp.]
MSEKNIIQLIVGPIATNCWICPYDGGKAAIIDPGDDAGLIISTLEKSKLAPSYILLTHGHFDHIGAVPQLVLSFAGIQIAAHRLDSHYLGADAYDAQIQSIKAATGRTDLVDDAWKEMPPADILLEEGDKIACFSVLHLPGHTQGSAGFFDEDAGLLFTGDTLFNRGVGRTDLPGGSDDQMHESLRRLFTMDGNIKVYPGHGRTTTIAQEANR